MRRFASKMLVVLLALVLAAGVLTVRATDEAEVLRASLHNGDAGVQIRGLSLVAGNAYTMSFWMRNAEGSGSVAVEWGQWPTFDGEDPLLEGDSALGAWVHHELTFTALAGATDIQIAPVWAQRNAGDVYYLSSVRITAADGTVTVVAPGQMHAAWSAEVVTVEVVANPAPTAAAAPAAPAAPAATVNPQTGDGFSFTWMLVSGVGLVAALSVLVGVMAARKKEK